MQRLLILCLAGAWASSGFAQEAKPAKSPLLDDGQLRQVRAPLGQIFQFTFDGPNLKIDRPAWESAGAAAAVPQPNIRANPAPPVENIFRQIQQAAGPAGSSMSLGGRDRMINFQGRTLHGRFDLRGDVIRIFLEEVEAPRRTLDFSEDGQGSFRIQLTHPEGDIILLNQSRKGPFTAVAVASGKMFAGQGETFSAFLRQHRRALDEHVLPVLEPLGIQPVLSLQSPKLRMAVLSQLLRTPETLAEGQKLLGDLDSDRFVTREQAAKTLHDRFELFRDAIQERLADKAISLEMRTRLEKIVADHADALRVSQTVAALDLTRDAGYLVSLLDHVGPKDLPRVIGHLEKTTGKKLGGDAAAWKKWAGEGRK